MPSLFRVLTFALAVVLTVSTASADATPAAPTPPPGLIGLTRDEVIAVRGKPSGERARGDGSVVLVYPDGTKVELREGRVASVAGVGGAEIVGADGTRYVPGADGNIKRPIQVSDPAAQPAVAPEAAPAPAAAVETTADEDEAAEEELPPGAKAPPVVDAVKKAAAVDAAEASEEFGDEEEPEMSAAAKIASFVIEAVLRLGLAILVLRLALHVVGVPFFWPDLLKVAVLYLAVHETMHSLGGLGGLWEFIPLCRLDSIVSFIILACSLTWFKIAGSGLTAIKIAAATGMVLYFLMLGIGVAIALVMPSLLG